MCVRWYDVTCGYQRRAQERADAAEPAREDVAKYSHRMTTYTCLALVVQLEEGVDAVLPQTRVRQRTRACAQGPPGRAVAS